MSPADQHDVLARLRAANPVAVKRDLGHSQHAQDTLQRILADTGAPERAPEHARRPRHAGRRAPRGLAVALAMLVVGGGAAFASTDPLGWWSANPSEAKYGANPNRTVPTPRLRVVKCHALSSPRFSCSAGGSGRTYTLIDRIRPPRSLDRGKISAFIARALAAGRLTAGEAARLRADLAAVPDSFFRLLATESLVGTYGGSSLDANGRTLVPPVGVPEFLDCEGTGTRLACRDVNGSESLAVGSGVYIAERTPDWRIAPPESHGHTAPSGAGSFTAAESRLLRDLAGSRAASSGGSSVHGSTP
jgi:hypothetical protein